MKKMLAVAAAASIAAAAVPAFAANPFSDVPMNHWAYDAVEQLAAKGILDGYPNGTFKGNRAMTRYEIATMVARMMAKGVGGADADQLQKLISEFAPELEALGVKVDGFDGRLSALEKGMGGWRLSGEMQFDYNAFKKDFRDKLDEKHGFEFDSARLFLHRDMAKGVTFDAEFSGGVFDRYWVTAEDFLGWGGLTFKAGQFDIDFEDDDGLYYGEHEDAGFFQGLPYRGVQLTKEFGLAEISGFYASAVGDDDVSIYLPNEGGEHYGARLKFNFGERAWLSGNYYISKPGDNAEVLSEEFKVWWIAAGFKFGSGIELKGAFYKQDLTDPITTKDGDVDDPKAWKVILAVDQDTLKFTSLWAEYAKFDAGFVTENMPYAFHARMADYASIVMEEQGWRSLFPGDTDVLFVALKQEWNEKFSTFERYHHFDIDGYDKVKDWAVGVGYQYTPNLYFELAYNRVDAGDLAPEVFKKGDIIRFRTLLSF